MKLRLPDDFISKLPERNPNLLKLVLLQLSGEVDEFASDPKDASTDCVIQLIKVSKKSAKYKPLADFMLDQISSMTTLVKQSVERRDLADFELGEMY